MFVNCSLPGLGLGVEVDNLFSLYIFFEAALSLFFWFYITYIPPNAINGIANSILYYIYKLFLLIFYYKILINLFYFILLHIILFYIILSFVLLLYFTKCYNNTALTEIKYIDIE